MTRLVDADALIAAIQREIDDVEDTMLQFPTDERQEEWSTSRAELRWALRLIERRAAEATHAA